MAGVPIGISQSVKQQVMGWAAEELFQLGARDIFLSTMPNPGLSPIQPPKQWVLQVLSLRVKWLRGENDL
jgi:hypothetical protein